MNTLYNFLVGNRKNSSVYVNSEAVESAEDVLDENGFVMVNSENREQEKFIQNEDSQSPILQRQCATDTLCCTGDTSSFQTSRSPAPCSSVADIPMQTAAVLTTLESCRTLTVSRRKYLDLDLFNYDFTTEISVLNDADVSLYEKREH